MTPKRIEYDPHAVGRMRTRRFTRADVRWLLAEGIKAPEGTRDNRWGARGYIRGQEAKVIYLENQERLYILTVEWIISGAKVAKNKRKEKGE